MTAGRPSFKLVHEQARVLAMAAIMKAPEGWHVTIRPPTRTLDANARFHAMLTAIVKSGYALEGRKFDVDDLKTLFVSAWLHEKKLPSDVVRGFNGEPVQLRRSTTTFSKEEMGELMDLVEAFAAERGIDLGERQ